MSFSDRDLALAMMDLLVTYGLVPSSMMAQIGNPNLEIKLDPIYKFLGEDSIGKWIHYWRGLTAWLSDQGISIAGGNQSQLKEGRVEAAPVPWSAFTDCFFDVQVHISDPPTRYQIAHALTNHLRLLRSLVRYFRINTTMFH